MKRRPSAIIITLALLVAFLGVIVFIARSSSGNQPRAALATNAVLDPGTTVSGPAPDFTLADQFGRRVSLRAFRGRVVILAFNDSECTTVCPLTTTAMVDARKMLGSAGSHVELLGVEANPTATSIRDVRAYSRLHGMLQQWHFLTGSLSQLKRVWKAYGIAVQVVQGQIDHTPALFVINPKGRLEKVYLTQMSYASVGQLAQIIAREASRLLPGHPPVHSSLSYAQVPSLAPSSHVSLPRSGGGRAALGPGAPHLEMFFATWVRESFNLAAQLEELDRYESVALADHLPCVTAVDEGSVEPSAQALPRFLRSLPRPLSYPVAVDAGGRVADGYEVQDEPWFEVTSRSGHILWYYDASTQGPISVATLVKDVRAALSAPPKTPAVNPDILAGAGQLAAVHAQAGQLLGSEAALIARIRALHGYPVVINAWASWCTPCREEFSLFASADARYGHRVAFLGVDTDDDATDGRSFLTKHPVGYPSYQAASAQLGPLAAIEGLPTTIFINRAGRVVSVHTGQYDTQGTLDEDIDTYALGG